MTKQEDQGESQWNPLIEKTGNPDLPYACIFEKEETIDE